MRFDLLCEKLPLGDGDQNETIRYSFDTTTGRLWIDENKFVGLKDGKLSILDGDITEPVEHAFDPAWQEPPGKSRDVKRLKIQLGMSCNYSCSYCSQRFVERPEQGNPEKVDGLIEKLRANFDLPAYGNGLRVEFWGGEPLVYWKTMRPLAEKLRALLPKAQFSIITNGSLLTRDIVDWLDAYGFGVSISHDGPGQAVRGPCPIEDGPEETKDAIQYAIKKFHRTGRGSFGSMLHRNNMSRAAVQEWFESRFGPGISIGEGGMIDAYDDDGFALSLNTKAEHFEFRRLSLQEILDNACPGFSTVKQRIDSFVAKMVENRPLLATQVQKCGMDDPASIAIDMNGDVITCQNVSAVATAMNGEPHKIGNIEQLEDVRLTSATHWTSRPHCQSCPVVSVCSGNCMFIQGDNWFKSCDSAFSDNIVMLSVAVLQLTGYLPVFIDADHLPDHRKDIWGSIIKHKEAPSFPIKVVSA